MFERKVPRSMTVVFFFLFALFLFCFVNRGACCNCLYVWLPVTQQNVTLANKMGFYVESKQLVDFIGLFFFFDAVSFFFVVCTMKKQKT